MRVDHGRRERGGVISGIGNADPEGREPFDGELDDARATALEATKAAAERRDEMRFLEALPAAERYRREWVEFTVFFDWLVSNFATPGPPPLPSSGAGAGGAEQGGGMDAGRARVLPAPRQAPPRSTCASRPRRPHVARRRAGSASY